MRAVKDNPATPLGEKVWWCREGNKRPSLDEGSWGHPSHPLLSDSSRLGARSWAGEKFGLFEHPVWYSSLVFFCCVTHQAIEVPLS
ncbi:MAG: hypothetical protein EWM73_03061 [Nitrospira sp.]|nr:MAG: hypothetical protein EWM73_03061 [Nitrospira sp.]